jgi:hypothetical protein
MYKIEEDFSKDEYMHFINKIEGIRWNQNKHICYLN